VRVKWFLQEAARRAAASALGSAACWALAAGCVSGQTRIGEVFDNSWRDEGKRSMVLLEERLRSVPIPRGANVAVGVTDSGLVGVPLGGGSTWSFAHALSGRPELAGAVVVGSGGGEIFCLQASTGALLWRRPTGGQGLIGAGDDGEITVVTLDDSGGLGSYLLAVDRGGHVLRQLESNKRLGRPAIIAGLAFIPWSQRFVTAYDITSGEEVARMPLELPVTSAFLLSGSLYFGDATLLRFDEALVAPPAQPHPLALPDIAPFGELRMLPSPSDRLSTLPVTADKVRAYARPTPTGQPLALEGNSYVTTYQRLAFGMSAGSTTPRWVHSHDSDFLAGAVFDGGVALCDVAGQVVLLEADTGLESAALALGQPLRACVVQADGLRRAPSHAPAPPLASQIAEALSVGVPGLAPAQAWLLRTLGELDQAPATRVLIEMSAEAGIPEAARLEIDALLSARRSGVDDMLGALSRNFDFVRGVPGPPVGPLADALAALGDRRAAPLLARLLNDPQTRPGDVRRAARALLSLASADELPELDAFFALYRCAAEDDDISASVALVAQGIIKLGGQAGRERVARGAADPLTLPDVRRRLAPLVEGVKVPADPPAFVGPGRRARR
jgi:outer membrane protein assembly factor BamB